MRTFRDVLDKNMKLIQHSKILDKNITDRKHIEWFENQMACEIGKKMLEDKMFRKQIGDTPEGKKIILEIITIEPTKFYTTFQNDIQLFVLEYLKEHQQDNIVQILSEMIKELKQLQENILSQSE